MTSPLSNPMNMLWACIGLHLLADYALQGCLSELKQKRWWTTQMKQLYESFDKKYQTYELKWKIRQKYKYDYMAGLFCHALMWTLVTFFPLMWFCSSWTFTGVVLVNTLVHFVVDHMKANVHRLNLVQDQLIHLEQVVATVLIVMLSGM